MKKITLFAFAALSLTLASCNKEQIQPASENGNTITMTLNASVEQTKATISNEWKFAFTEGDNISLTNNLATVYYPVTCGSDGKFTGTVTAPQSAAIWYAYYPSNNVSFDNQTGTQAGAAECYAYSGKQENVAAGSKNLDITLNPQTAILVITSKRASLDINVKTSDGKWVSGLTAKSGDATFDVTTSDAKVSLLKATKPGTYYIVVPAGVQIAIYDGDTQIKETKDSGLTAGKYYNVTIEARTIADVLATVDGGFPQGTDNKNPSDNAWVCGSDRYTFEVGSGNSSVISFYNSSGDGNATDVPLTTLVTPGENCYTATSGENTLTFQMTDGKLTSINFSSTNDSNQSMYGGTYTAPPLPGVFSVSANKKVRFSRGNLIATIDASGVPTAWKFAANQYDYRGKGGANQTIGNTSTSGTPGDVDLFGWSTSNDAGTSTTDNYGIMTSTTDSDYSGNFYDWGKAYCVSKSISPDNTWRTLTTEEWQYLFSYDGSGSGGQNYENDTRRDKYKYGVTVCGKTNCVVLLPDYWVWDVNTVGTGWQTAYPETADDSHPVTWQAMEAAGAVCLPAAGGREGSSINSGGNYWSSTANGSSTAYYVCFGSNYVNLGYSGNRFNGCSVRLITECQ